jgi:hypothetical protein
LWIEKMPIDEASSRLAFLLQIDLRRLIDRERSRTERGEDVRYDSVSRMATWETRRGDVIGRWYGEVIATYVPTDRILRWAWAGRSRASVSHDHCAGRRQAPLGSGSHAEVVSQEGQARGVAQLSMSVVGDLDEADACTLARLGVLVARGDGIQVERSENEVRFIGLFDSPRPRDGDREASRYSVPPPAVSPRSSPPSGSGSSPPVRSPSPPSIHPPASSPPRRGSTPPTTSSYRSLPPIREIYGPRTSPRGSSNPPPAEREPEKKIREPARGLFLPVAAAVLSALTKNAPGFQQALFVLAIHTDNRADAHAHASGEKRPAVVTLVAVDAGGVLRALDPSHDLVEAAIRMVEADRNDGNGPWRKLTARVTPKPDGGATLHVDVI